VSPQSTADCQSPGGLPSGMALGCGLTSVRGNRGENYELLKKIYILAHYSAVVLAFLENEENKPFNSCYIKTEIHLNGIYQCFCHNSIIDLENFKMF
jgi:hypothetical protein